MKQKSVFIIGLILSVSLLSTNVLAMTKSELIEDVAKKSGHSKETTEEILEAFLSVITETIEEQGRLYIGSGPIGRLRLFLSHLYMNRLGIMLGADRGEPVMCIADNKLIGGTVRFGDGIRGRIPPS